MTKKEFIRELRTDKDFCLEVLSALGFVSTNEDGSIANTKLEW